MALFNATNTETGVTSEQKDLWMVETFFQVAKSLPETRLAFHKYDKHVTKYPWAKRNTSTIGRTTITAPAI